MVGITSATTGRMRFTLALICATAVAAWGCASDKSPSGPTQPQIDLTGTWKGQLAVQGTTAAMTWTLTQTGSAVSGPILVTLPNGIVLMNGALTGTLAGTSLQYTIAVSPGGIPTQPGCSGQLGGRLTATMGTPSTLNGNYTVNSSTCTPPFASSGDINLTR